MRISFAGAAGIGKTTLAETLAERLAIPVIGENFGEIVQVFNFAAPEIPLHEKVAMRRKACLEWLAKRELAYSNTPQFVEDRCAVDILFRWLAGNLSDRSNSETSQIIDRTRKLLEQIDYLVILPLTLTTEEHNTDGLTRAGSLNRLFRAQALTIGIAHQLLGPAKTIFVPESCRTVEDRANFVLNRTRLS